VLLGRKDDRDEDSGGEIKEEDGRAGLSVKDECAG
jgi:hypothetical protein